MQASQTQPLKIDLPNTSVIKYLLKMLTWLIGNLERAGLTLDSTKTTLMKLRMTPKSMMKSTWKKYREERDKKMVRANITIFNL